MRLHNRQIKASFWTDSELIKNLNRDGRIFYMGLIQLADDSGCLEDDALAFKIHIFPADMDITPDILVQYRDKLVEMNKLIPYQSGGKSCLYLKNFHKHQSLDNPAKPDVPLPHWIKFTPYSSNKRAGKYVIQACQDVDVECNLQLPYTSLTDSLQVPSNQNQNQNLYKEDEEDVRAREDISVKSSDVEQSTCVSVESEKVLDKPTESQKDREGKVFRFFSQNIGMITPFQSQTLSQYLDDGLDPGLIIAVMQDSLGKDDKWSWSKKVLENSLKLNVRTSEQYEAHKLERAKSRDKPPGGSKNMGKKAVQAGNFTQRQYSDDHFDKLYKDV